MNDWLRRDNPYSEENDMNIVEISPDNYEITEDD